MYYQKLDTKWLTAKRWCLYHAMIMVPCQSYFCKAKVTAIPPKWTSKKPNHITRFTHDQIDTYEIVSNQYQPLKYHIPGIVSRQRYNNYYHNNMGCIKYKCFRCTAIQNQCKTDVCYNIMISIITCPSSTRLVAENRLLIIYFLCFIVFQQKISIFFRDIFYVLRSVCR